MRKEPILKPKPGLPQKKEVTQILPGAKIITSNFQIAFYGVTMCRYLNCHFHCLLMQVIGLALKLNHHVLGQNYVSCGMRAYECHEKKSEQNSARNASALTFNNSRILYTVGR